MQFKNIIALIFILFIIASCAPIEPLEQESKCDSIQDASRKIMCVAMETNNLFLCSTIESSRFKDSCILAVAELVKDSSQVADCNFAEQDINKIICKALVMKDIDICFDIKDNANHADLSLRDCVNLLARKLKQQNICSVYSTRTQEFIEACGSTSSECKALWQDGMNDNIQNCLLNI